MFLASLNDEQKKAFLAIGMKIIGADSHLDVREREMIQGMRYEMGLFHPLELPHSSIEDLAKTFDSKRSQSIVLLESIGLAYSDGDYTEKEKKILRALALSFNISEEEATEMENWVLDYKKLIKKAEAILSR